MTDTAKSPAMLFYLDNFLSADPRAAQRLAQERAYQQELAKKRAEEARVRASMDEELAIAEGFRISDLELNDAKKKLEGRQEVLKKLFGDNGGSTEYARQASNFLANLAGGPVAKRYLLHAGVALEYDSNVPLAPDVLKRKVDLLLEHFPSQRGKHWFTEDLFRSLARVRGMEANSPTLFAEGFRCRKLVLAG